MKLLNDRQGDVRLKQIEDFNVEECEEIPRDEKGRIILAYGEVTGHAHAIHDKNAILFRHKESGKIFLLITKLVNLVHEEHSTISFPPGKYKVIRQREYTPEEIRYVAD